MNPIHGINGLGGSQPTGHIGRAQELRPSGEASRGFREALDQVEAKSAPRPAEALKSGLDPLQDRIRELVGQDLSREKIFSQVVADELTRFLGPEVDSSTLQEIRTRITEQEPLRARFDTIIARIAMEDAQS